MASICFIVNPKSQGGKTGKRWDKTYSYLQQALSDSFQISYLIADGIGTGVEKTTKAIEEGSTLLISVGGEGTTNEVLNGILKSGKQDIKLGFIRSGTVNDYLRAKNWPVTLDDQIELIRKMDFVRTPVVKVTGTYSKFGLNVADLGVGAKIAYMASVERRLTWIRSAFRYQLLSIRAVLGWSNVPASIEIDGNVVEGNLSLLTSGFSPYSGAYHLHPHAELFGEKMAYTMAMEFSKLDMIKKMKMLEKGEHSPEMENIYMGHAKKIRILTEEPMLYEVDGEPFLEPASDITIEAMPSKIDVLQI